MKKFLVGPVEIPEEVLDSMHQPSISHRTPAYEKVHQKVEAQLQKLFGTEQEIMINTSSGTGSMEAAIANCFSRGDHVLVPLMGNFSRQFATMCRAYHLDVETIEFEYGESADPAVVEEHLKPETKGIFLTHNESSSGVMHDLEAFAKLTRDRDCLLVVDSISGAGGLPIQMDAWGVDIIITSSQKCLMSPAGLSFMALSDKAWKRTETSDLPRFYFDLQRQREFNKKHQTATTPGIYNLFAVSKALDMMEAEGFDAVQARSKRLADKLRSGLKAMGFKLFAKPQALASDTLTTVYLPGEAKIWHEKLKQKGFLVGGGLVPYQEDTIRIGTMGYVFDQDIDELLEAMKELLDE